MGSRAAEDLRYCCVAQRADAHATRSVYNQATRHSDSAFLFGNLPSLSSLSMVGYESPTIFSTSFRFTNIGETHPPLLFTASAVPILCPPFPFQNKIPRRYSLVHYPATCITNFKEHLTCLTQPSDKLFYCSALFTFEIKQRHSFVQLLFIVMHICI